MAYVDLEPDFAAISTPLELPKEELDGYLSYRMIQNDKVDQSLVDLLECKNLFGRQLPKMPKDYITKLVFDRRHITLCANKRSTSGSQSTVAAVCFRPFGTFVEIVFLAVDSSEQVRGYGSRLMNVLKDILRGYGVTDMVTFADNGAVGYFQKQGFVSASNEQDRFEGFIKEYDGANKMRCSLIDGFECSMLMSQAANEVKAALWESFLGSSAGRNSDGSCKFREYIPKKVEKQPSNQLDLPMAKPSPVNKDVVNQFARKLMAVANASSHAWPFRLPIKVDEVPDYYDVISTPMDLSTMTRKADSNEYESVDDLMKDFQLIHDNCLEYNGKGNVYFMCATKLLSLVESRRNAIDI